MAESDGGTSLSTSNSRLDSSAYSSLHSHSYPSPSMQPYQYPPHQQQSGNDAYRHSPTAANASLPSINLPPIRAADGQASGHASPGQQPGAAMPPPVQTMYYQQHGVMSPGQMNPATPQQMMRYPIPAQAPDARILAGRPAKKDIKRRTKTGCLTCRKRRIKCDEQHPTCRNCQKSKRECLGYDPIFKPQQGPPQLQPAPTASPAASTATSGSSSSHSAAAPSYSSPTNSHTSANPLANSSSSTVRPFEFGSAIDPALAGAETKTMTTMAPNHQSPAGGLQPTCSGGPLKIDQLFWIAGITPPELAANPPPLEQNVLDEIKSMYINEFAPGLNAFFETRWYSSGGVEQLLASSDMCNFMAELIKRYKTVVGSDYGSETACRVLETKAVWKLALLCRNPPVAAHGANGRPPSHGFEVEELAQRLEIIEALLTKSTTPSNPVTKLRYSDVGLPTEKKTEIQFWHTIGDFVTLKLDDDANGAKLDSILNSARHSLNRLENRDVIYSILVTRHLGRRVLGFPDRIPPANPSAGEADDTNKVALAKEFITVEANWKGTTHPIQRLCDMAVRSWTLR